MLRDFGFGTPTGAEFPSESRGQLARPDRWQPMYTRASMAMGYEFGVTPVQLAAAYGAIANDGILLAPTLVREVRDPAGKVLYRHEPEPVRRVVSPEIAARLREFLRGAVGEGGTGDGGAAGQLHGAGQDRHRASGSRTAATSRGKYTASFAAIFPADDPQLVVIVKIDNPKGSYYGGLTAAPVTRTMLQQALASRRVAIDRGAARARRRRPARGAGRRPPVRRRGRSPVVVPGRTKHRLGHRQPVTGAECRGTVGSRGRARAAPAGVPGEPARTGASRADDAGRGQRRSPGASVYGAGPNETETMSDAALLA